MFSFQCIPLSVRVNNWKSHLLSQKEIEKLLDYSLHDLIYILKEKEQKIHFESDNNYSIEFLYMSQARYIKNAITMNSWPTKSFLQILCFSFEVSNLKILVRTLLSKKTKGFFYSQDSSILLSPNEVREVTSFQDLALYLENYPDLSEALSQTIDQKNTLYWELALDNIYLKKILRSAKKLSKNDMHCVKKLVIFPIFYDRVILAYRLLFHYSVDAAEVLVHIPGIKSVISDEDWAHLLSMPTSSEFFEYLFSLHYITDPSSLSDAFSLSSYFANKTELEAKSYLKKKFGTLAPFLAFIQLKKIKDQKISVLLESKSLSVSKLDVMNFL